jgi:hypothetical protein
MYKAVHAQTGKEYVILNPYWLSRLAELRALDQADLLVCQGCRQPLRVKAGEVKRPHFAHKHLQACAYGSESPEILAARAVLYDLLQRYFGERLTVEKQMEGQNLPRPVDCWVETSAGTFAYWIIEAGIRQEPREAIRSALASPGIHAHYLFLARMLNEEKKEFHSLLLTPTERAFLQPTPYDEMLSGPGELGGSLHYIDAEQQVLITYRNMVLFHKPNWFKGRKKSAGLDAVRVNTQDGSFAYEGEKDRLNAYRQKRQRLEQKRKQYEQRAAEYTDSHPAPLEKPWNPGVRQWKRGSPEAPEALPCADCGQVTTDYWSTFFDPDGRKFCRCRQCLDQSGE